MLARAIDREALLVQEMFDLQQQLDKAEQNVLAALEAAPGYRPAQRLLLQIEDATPPRPR